MRGPACEVTLPLYSKVAHKLSKLAQNYGLPGERRGGGGGGTRGPRLTLEVRVVIDGTWSKRQGVI